MSAVLAATGERMLPEMKDAVILIEHLHRYAMAIEFCKDKIVLDIASGEGYGSNLISRVAKQVIGVDIDELAVQHANEKYKSANLFFKQGNAASIPLDNESVDVLVSFETLEHHDKHDEMMQEVKRLLRKDGILIISTPDKKFYSDVPGYHNPYHVKELYSHEFFKLVGDQFAYMEILGQSSGLMSALYPFKKNKSTDYWFATGDTNNLIIPESLPSIYLIAIASQQPFTYRPVSVFDGKELESVIREQNKLIHGDPVLSILNSKTYKVGNMILGPLKWVKNIFKKKS